jgi:hypothetical protein
VERVNFIKIQISNIQRGEGLGKDRAGRVEIITVSKRKETEGVCLKNEFSHVISLV